MANISKIAVGGTEYDIAGVGLIATIETTLTASKTYNVGDQFIYNGLLYKVTQTIASGTAITIGSNCQLAPVVADQLSEINSNLSNQVVLVTDVHTLGALSSGASGFYSKAIDVPTGYHIVMVTAQVSAVAVVQGDLLLNASFSGSSIYVNYRAFNNIAADKSNVASYILCVKS